MGELVVILTEGQDVKQLGGILEESWEEEGL